MSRFVRDDILLPKLPIFINSYKDGGVTEEIKEKRKNETNTK